MLSNKRPRFRIAALAALALVGAAGCSGKSPFGSKDPAASRLKPENGGIVADPNDFSHLPVPPADGPKLAPIAMSVAVMQKPDPKAETLGYLRIGARVARSDKPVGNIGCPEGWYAIRPAGFVCVGPNATLKLDHPLARAIQVEPDRSKPMPYKYAFLRSIAPNYMRVPSKAEQFQYEMRLDRHLRSWKRLHEKWDALSVGANDVPLDESGIANGAIPGEAAPMNENQRFGGNGDDRVPWWLEGDRRIPNISSFKTPSFAVIADRLKRHAGVSLIGTFVAGPEAQNRRFAISTDARLIPADKLKAESGSPFHGVDIKQVGLPVAFAQKDGANFYDFGAGAPARAEALPGREFVALSGNIKEYGGERYVQARSGKWLKSAELRTAAKSSKLPAWAARKAKWIDISIQNQTLVLWEGDIPVYATLVSTGRDGMGDPQKTLSTPMGTFRVYQKHITTTMDSSVADHEFELRDVPWVMYFKGGYALHAAYWHDDFGHVRSHGCVNMSPIDARRTFIWSSPEVPEHWQAAYTTDALEQGTIVYIHP
ncbi:MAG TPA: L,D-transpeptidase [Polyangiaceae bacterium]|jgi:lipoprotein-anchoring transpeptidase ErfK/SrfK